MAQSDVVYKFDATICVSEHGFRRVILAPEWPMGLLASAALPVTSHVYSN
jgi:hypothetical protein